MDGHRILELLSGGGHHGAYLGKDGGYEGQEADGDPRGGAARLFLPFLRVVSECLADDSGSCLYGILEWLRRCVDGDHLRQCGSEESGSHAWDGADSTHRGRHRGASCGRDAGTSHRYTEYLLYFGGVSLVRCRARHPLCQRAEAGDDEKGGIKGYYHRGRPLVCLP